MTEQIAEYRVSPPTRTRLRAVPESAGDVVTIRPGLLRFALLMELKLRRDDGEKPPWETGWYPDHYRSVMDETDELFDALERLPPVGQPLDRERLELEAVFEAVDVALSAMMVAGTLDPVMIRYRRGKVAA